VSDAKGKDGVSRPFFCSAILVSMTKTSVIPVLLVLASWGAAAQGVIYRCGNEYTNSVTEDRAKNCTIFSGGNVTIVQSVKPAGNAQGASAAANPVTRATPSNGANQRVDAGEQRARDSDARMILEMELKKAEARQLELQKEYNNGEPEKLGPEARNHQKYLDRVAELKAALSRNESDIAGLRRELGRLPAPSAKP
jgi:hypothetical protein